jgi:hypothetical protein
MKDKMTKDKTGSMEMSVGTIVTIVLLMAVLVLGLTLTRGIFRGATDSVTDLNAGVKQQINDLFGEENKNLIISLGSQKTASVKQGTDNFGIPMGFAPDDPNAWGPTKEGCTYSIEASEDGDYCIKQGWDNPEEDIISGTSKVNFDELQDGSGYAIISISIPEDIPPCLQKFSVSVGCAGTKYSGESTKTYFIIEVVKKGLF